MKEQVIEQVKELLYRSRLPEDMREVVESYNSYSLTSVSQFMSDKGLFLCTKHYFTYKDRNRNIPTIIQIMNEAIEILALSIDEDTQVIDTVHYIVSEDESRIVIFLQMKDDEVSSAFFPRFIGKQFSNIEVLRRIATNLSGQYNIKIRLFL